MLTIIDSSLQFANRLFPLIPEKVIHIVIHHIEFPEATVEEIHSWHLGNGWSGIGYNEYIRKDGTVYIGRGDNIGAQCQGYNSVSYGIACEGNYDIEREMPEAQFKALVERVKVNMYKWNTDSVKPHKKFNATDCPGQFFPMEKLYETIRKSDKLKEAEEFLTLVGENLDRYNLVLRMRDIYRKAGEHFKTPEEKEWVREIILRGR